MTRIPGAGLRALAATDHPVPEPGPDEVLVQVRANSLNAREFSILQGTYPLSVKPGVVMCADGAFLFALGRCGLCGRSSLGSVVIHVTCESSSRCMTPSDQDYTIVL